MRLISRVVSACLLTMGIAMFTACTAHSQPTVAAANPSYVENQLRVPGEYIVTLTSGINESVISERFGSYGIKGISELGNQVFLLILSNDPGAETMENQARKDHRIKAIQPNFIYRINPSDGSTQ